MSTLFVATTRPVEAWRNSKQQQEARRRDAFKALERFNQEPLEDVCRRIASEKWRAARAAAMRAWRNYFVAVDIEPDAIWSALGLRQNVESYNNTINYCRAFLLDYVQYSERPRLTLAKEEYVMERSVKAAYSVIAFWRCVVLEADATVVEEKRRGNPAVVAWRG